MNDTADVIIVGGGPVGLYSLYYAGLRSMKAKLIDALPELGGQLYSLYPENDVLDVAGVPQIKARDLVENLKKQALQYDPEICLGERVVGVSKHGDMFEVVTDKGQHQGRSVVIAAGPGAYVPGCIFDQSREKQEACGLFIEPENISAVADRRVLICGGKQEAIGWAMEAATVATSVTTITHFELYDGDGARVNPDFNRVDVMSPYLLKELHGEKAIEAASVIHAVTGEVIRLKIDAVIMARGQITNLEPMRAWGFELLNNGVKVDRSMATSCPGVFAAGDIVIYPGKVRTINAGAGEAAIAINKAKAFIDPGAPVQPEYTAGN